MNLTITTTVIELATTFFADSFALLAALTLLALLIQKEMVHIVPERRFQRLSRALNVAILPLVLAFIAIVVVKLINML